MPDLKCGNCEETIQANWEICPSCHANLKKGKYSSVDDPLDGIKKDVQKIKDHLQAEHDRKEKEKEKEGKHAERKGLFED